MHACGAGALAREYLAVRPLRTVLLFLLNPFQPTACALIGLPVTLR